MGAGILYPNPAFLTMISTFALSTVIGYYSVWGVVPALHTPLMSITNAISGITAAGGLLLMGGGLFPHTYSQFLGGFSVLMSCVNIGGGVLITKRMLQMFKSKENNREYSFLYGLPGITLVSALCYSNYLGLAGIYQMGYLIASLCCITGIAGLAS